MLGSAGDDPPDAQFERSVASADVLMGVLDGAQLIPAFMTAAPLASALRASTDGDPGDPEAALLREIQVPPEKPVTAVYRVRTAHAEDYGLPGDGLLTDEHGSPILLTEGLVLRGAASAVMEAGVPRAALDQAHALVTPAYQAFWAEGGQFARRTGQPFILGLDDPSGAQLQLESPRPAAGMAAADDSEGSTPDDPGEHGRSRARAAVILGVAIILAALVLAGVVVAIRLLVRHPDTARTAAQTMTDLCSALQSSSPGSAYSLTTSGYRARNTERNFIAEVLPQGSAVPARCTYRLLTNPGNGTAQAAMTAPPKATPCSAATDGFWQFEMSW